MTAKFEVSADFQKYFPDVDQIEIEENSDGVRSFRFLNEGKATCTDITSLSALDEVNEEVTFQMTQFDEFNQSNEDKEHDSNRDRKLEQSA